jgi:hypothetical protein
MRKRQVMRKIFLITFVMIAQLGMGQSDSSKFALEMGWNGGFGFRRISASEDFKWMKTNLDEIESGRYVQGFGLGFTKRISKSLDICTGINFQKLGHKTDTLESQKLESLTYTLQYLQVPVALRYKMNSSRKMIPFVQLGVQYGYLVGVNQEYKIRNANRMYKDNSFNDEVRGAWSTTAALGFIVPMYKNSSFLFSLNGQYGLSSTTPGDLSKHYYCASLFLGWNQRF